MPHLLSCLLRLFPSTSSQSLSWAVVGNGQQCRLNWCQIPHTRHWGHVTSAHWTDYSKNANILSRILLGPWILRISIVWIYFVWSWQWPTMSTKLMPNPAFATLGARDQCTLGWLLKKWQYPIKNHTWSLNLRILPECIYLVRSWQWPKMSTELMPIPRIANTGDQFST